MLYALTLRFGQSLPHGRLAYLWADLHAFGTDESPIDFAGADGMTIQVMAINARSLDSAMTIADGVVDRVIIGMGGDRGADVRRIYRE